MSRFVDFCRYYGIRPNQPAIDIEIDAYIAARLRPAAQPTRLTLAQIKADYRFWRDTTDRDGISADLFVSRFVARTHRTASGTPARWFSPHGWTPVPQPIDLWDPGTFAAPNPSLRFRIDYPASDAFTLHVGTAPCLGDAAILWCAGHEAVVNECALFQSYAATAFGLHFDDQGRVTNPEAAARTTVKRARQLVADYACRARLAASTAAALYRQDPGEVIAAVAKWEAETEALFGPCWIDSGWCESGEGWPSWPSAPRAARTLRRIA